MKWARPKSIFQRNTGFAISFDFWTAHLYSSVAKYLFGLLKILASVLVFQQRILIFFLLLIKPSKLMFIWENVKIMFEISKSYPATIYTGQIST